MSELNTPRDFVQSGWDYYRGLGNQWLLEAKSALTNLTYTPLAPMTFEVPVELTVEFGSFLRPVAPTAPVIPALAVTLPTAPTLTDIAVPVIDTAPTEPNFSGLVYAKPTAPTAAMPTRPTDTDVVLDQIIVPDAPAYTLPTDPALYTINLPAVPNLTVPTFDGIRPNMNLTAPVQSFSWTYSAHDATMINTIKSRLSEMAFTGLALPPAVEALIFDRARGREDTLSAQAIQEATDDMAARGLRQPAGLLARTLERIRTTSRRASSDTNRALSIRMAELNVEGVRFALAQAITLEVALVQNNLAVNELGLRGAMAAQQIAIDLFNAQVALHNAQWEGYKADAQVFAERIRAIQAQADLYKAQIDAQKVIGDVNESLVRAYGERMRAIGVLGDFYRTSVEAARAKGEINTQRIEQARLKLQAFSTDVEAWGKLQDGYKTSVEAEIGNIRAHEALGNVYGRRIDAWSNKNKAYFDQGRFQIETQTQQLERYRAQLLGAKTDSELQMASIDALLRTYATKGSIFAAEGSISAAESAAQDRSAQIRIEQARLRIETGHKNLELTANYALKTLEAQIEQLKAKAQIISQLASATASGVNFGASYSGNLGVSYDHNASWSYSGDTPDYNGIPPNGNF